MAEPITIALARGSNAGRYPQLGEPKLLNCYVEELGEMGKHPFSIVAINGLESWGTLPDADALRDFPPVQNEMGDQYDASAWAPLMNRLLSAMPQR